MAKTPKQTPMMAQYHRLKGELPEGALLLFRLGDFYELFFDDAKAGADILNITLTKRGSTPMCGIPFHAADNYIGKLLQAGCKVAMCEQTEEAVPGKLVNREVTQILSPGTHFDEQILTAERNNYLAALSRQGKVFGLAVIDLTTGDFRTTEVDSLIALQAAQLVQGGDAPGAVLYCAVTLALGAVATMLGIVLASWRRPDRIEAAS